VRTRWQTAWSRREPTTGADGEGVRGDTLVPRAPRPFTKGRLARSVEAGERHASHGMRAGRRVTAGSNDEPSVRRERRIIERPRLIKLLDESEARIILLLAPAGYGKTTLARQWAKTLNGAIWVSLTPAHRNVATFAEDVARGIDALGGESTSFIREYVRARSNPQLAARDIAEALSQQFAAVRLQWLMLDDYHELTTAPEVEEMVGLLQERTDARLLIASRTRPVSATRRRILYGEVAEFDRDALAMTDEESRAVLGPKLANHSDLLQQAQGWPAVLGLAKSLNRPEHVKGVMQSGLHEYVADELFRSVSPSFRAQLISLALLPTLSRELIIGQFGATSDAVIERARDLGFLSTDEGLELHPLVRDFLLAKLDEAPNAKARVSTAVRHCIETENWDQALDLAHRFSLSEVLHPILEAAYKPLVRSGRIASLSRIAAEIRKTPFDPSPEADLVDAEVAFRSGEYHLAVQLMRRVRGRLSDGHPLRSRAAAIEGGAQFQLANFDESEQAFDIARAEADDDADDAEAVHGLVLAALYGERPSVDQRVEALGDRARRTGAPVDVARYAASALARMRIGPGFVPSPYVQDALRVLPQVEDPRARTSVMATLTYTLGLQCEYDLAEEVAERMLSESDAFGLDFARPHGQWNLAFVKLGLRKFAEVDRLLQAIEAEVQQRHLGHHVLNARVLRSRLFMQMARFSDALLQVSNPVNDSAAPSMHAEYMATRALALSLVARPDEASQTADLAISMSDSCDAQVLAIGARAVVAAEFGDADGARQLIVAARKRCVWDSAICCLRASPTLADSLARQDDLRTELQWLYNRTRDSALARRAGFRTRTNRSAAEILSPREREVLELMAQGFRNREIARAFVISESTVKVHVRHILEKLGVRTRAQAVAQTLPSESVPVSHHLSTRANAPR
jgi:DNA-binding NarL/FixJ family response regulator